MNPAHRQGIASAGRRPAGRIRWVARHPSLPYPDAAAGTCGGEGDLRGGRSAGGAPTGRAPARAGVPGGKAPWRATLPPSGYSSGSLPVRRLNASRYRSRVPATTSAGSSGGGLWWSQPVESSQFRTYCLSNDTGSSPGRQRAASQ
jgi:hypothetical protein